MPSSIKTGAIRSIAVALDCSPHSRASLDAAAELAARLKAELIGIFVEDINLLHLAGLPFFEEVRLYSTTTEKLDPDQLERLLRLQARQAGEMLQRTSETFRLRHTFRALRGIVPEIIMSAATDADMIVLGRSGRSPSCRKGLGSTAMAAFWEGKKSVMLMRPGVTAADGPLMVLYDGSESSRHALETALAISGPESSLHLIVTNPDPDAEEHCRHEVGALVESSGIAAEYHHLALTDPHQFARYVRMIDSGLLVLGNRLNIPEEILRTLVDEIDYPVLMVRPE
ncbi:MAG: universal stress protein [Chlorobiaceae bacterium]|nr:universal stress protein [Chlorobiaceae bacterium]